MGLANPGPVDNKARLRNKYDMQMPASSKQHYEQKYGNPNEFLQNQPKNIQEHR